ncbi:MAG TPA: DUF1697 domain-containing protein [Thermoanaerobaculia bacterium]|nr:DUF1697 domain-containing protein [Thermoanaerobaculia bacterium]
MPRFVAFLRAVNVGGRVVKMDALRKIFESMGLADVESFIASGNVVFSSKGVKGLDVKIAAGLERALGYEVPTFVRTAGEIADLAAQRPFAERDVAAFPTHLVGFLSKNLDAAGVERLRVLESPADRFHVRGRDFWWLSKHHQARPAITGRQLENALGEPTTLRNVNTIRRMAERYK